MPSVASLTPERLSLERQGMPGRHFRFESKRRSVRGLDARHSECCGAGVWRECIGRRDPGRRVVAADLSGYRWGVERKRNVLVREGMV